MKSKTSKIVAGLIALVLVVAVAIPMLSSETKAAFNKSSYAVTAEITDYDAMDIETILKRNESLTWVFAGDSITHNGSWAQGMNGYAEWFEQYLYDINRNNDSVINTAWGGADILDFQTVENTSGTNGTTEDKGMGIYNFITKYSPDVVFIKLGMNDRDQTTANFKTRYENMLTSLYDISYNSNKKIPKVIVIAPTPVSVENVYDDLHDPEQNLGSSTAGDEHYDSTLRVRNTLEDIVASCNDGGYKVLFSDFRTGFLQKAVEIGDDYHHTFFTDPSDGVIHPNAAGQYLMFNLLSDTLGIRDEEMSIYQIAYEEFENAALYAGEYSALEAYEMNKTAPTIDGVTPLANVDFDNTNGEYNGAGIQGIDYTSELTQAEAASLQDAFTVVLRAKFPEANSNNQPILFISSNGTDNWNNALSVGIPGNKAELYYTFRSEDKVQSLKSGTIAVSGGTYDADNMWHTIVVSYDAGTVKYYKDGQLLSTITGYGLNDGVTSIGSMFTNSTNYKVQLGRYGFKEDATSYSLNAKMDFWQFYGSALTDEQVFELSGNKSNYSGVVAENSVWVVAGAEQMSGYEGPVANRSMLRLFDNALRNKTASRDLRIVSAVAPGNTPAYLDANFDAVIGEHITATKAAGNNSVFMLLPEIPEVYANYDAATIETQVAAYKGYVESLIGKSASDIEILWTPLASNDATINGYLARYAEAVREVAAANEGVLLFDAYAYMNAYMTADATVARNWFDNNAYISPLGATDVTYAFINETGLSAITTSELTGHNLRYASDVRTFKGNYIRDYYEAVAAVSGETVTLDVSAIVTAGYTLDTSSVALLPEAGTGNYNENIIWLKDVASDLAYANNKFTFTAPCSDLDIAIYSEKDGKIYRFKDIDLTVDTDNVIDTTPNPTSAVLDSLEIVGLPAVDLSAGDAFDVTLYQYQKYPQVRATAQDGLKITVTYTDKDGKEVSEVVKSGKNSGLIPEEVTTVNVTVSGTVGGSVAEKTYTLNLTRPDYPDIIITEVMQDGYSGYDVSGYDNYELVEIYNASGKDLNLLNYSIGYKKDYPTDLITETKGEWPYYFTGNNQAFNGGAIYTGVNQITKYSSYWINDGKVTEPEEVLFPADSTMVIWVKEASADLTFDTLRSALQENAFAKSQKTLTVDVDGTETAVVPAETQLVVAEIPEGAKRANPSTRANTTADSSLDNFYMDDFGSVADKQTTRGWLFILGDEAQPATNGAISEAGNDIISASKFVRIGQAEDNDAGKIGIDPDRLSCVFSYNVERGMSLIKDEAKWDTDVNTFNVGHTSDEQGYSNLTSFGAIEYWQKPADLDDEKAPVVDESGVIFNVDSDTAAVRLAFSDDNDVRYIELNVKDEDGNVTTVTKDIVLASGVENGGLSPDNKKYEYTYAVADTDESSKITFWGYVEDGNGNVTEFGSEDEEVDVCTKAVQGFSGDKVADYLANGTYPTMDGKLFSGWYTVENIPTDLEEARAVSLGDAEVDENATYFALFVPKHVLSVKAQVSGTLYDDNMTNDDSASIRFVTTVDTLQYKKVGFKVSYLGTNETIGSHEVYKQLYAVGSSTDVMTEYTPQGEFCQMSNYFKTGTITGVPASYYNTEFKVTPYWITWDGTTVEGVTVVKTIEEGMPKDVAYVSASGVDQPGYGTYEYPYATLNYAIENVGHSGIVCIIGDYTIPADFAWNVHNKRVTIAGDAVETTGTKEKLDFSALSDLRINDAVTFSDITLTLPATVYAEGNDFTVAEDVTLNNTANTVTVYGGSKKLEVAKTNVKLYAGSYAEVFGGGNGTNVLGDTYVTLAGEANDSLSETFNNHSLHYDVFGGSNNGKVFGNTNVTIGTEDETDTDNARACIVYGGGKGASSVVEGKSNVKFIAGELMGIYGGSKQGQNSDTKVVMTGGFVEQIFGGSYAAAVTGNTDVQVLGGEVNRRIYGGCYNDFDEDNKVWASDKYVTGYTNVTIDAAADVSLAYRKSGLVKADNSVYATTRISKDVVTEGEIGVFIFMNDSFAEDGSKIGYTDDLILNQNVYKEYFSTKTHNYLVKASTGGSVYSEDGFLRIVPNGTNVAIVKIGNKVVHYSEQAESVYALPKLDSTTATKEIVVIFGTEKQDKANFEAKIDAAYYTEVEDALASVNTTDATTIELLKASVDVASTMSIADSQNITVKEAQDVDVTVTRADALVNVSVFDVEAGGTLTIEGITLDGRTAAEISAETIDLDSLTGSTASLINTAGEVHLKNVVAQYAVKTSGYGAVVYGENVSTALLKVENSEFKYNKAANQGGAICMYNGSSELEIKNSSFDHNESAVNGGAVSTHADNALIENCIFTNNIATENGGALYSGSSCETTVKNTTTDATKAYFSDNNAKNGGALAVGSGKFTIISYTFDKNIASVIGGAIQNSGSSSTMTIVNSKFTENEATKYGGAIVNASSAKMTVLATSKEHGVTEATLATMEGNASKGNISVNKNLGYGGGAVYFGSGSFSIDGYMLSGNTSQGDAGALCLRAVSTVTNCTFTENSAEQLGGALYCHNKATITGSTFTGNSAVGTYTTTDSEGTETVTKLGGGAICNAGTGTTITKSVFNGNTTEEEGGAIYTNVNMTISDSSFTSNKASQYGGAIKNSKGTTSVTDTTFTTNESVKNGGAINNSGTLTLVGTKDTALFDRNKTTGSGSIYGGAIYNDGTMTANKYIFTGNYNVYRGGAIGNYGKNPTITDCKFVGNHSAENGGAIYSGGGVTINIVATGTSELALFDGNYATGGTGGGAISIGSGTLKLTGYKFNGNYAKVGGAIYNSSNVTTTMTGIKGDTFGSLFTGNYATSGHGGAINLASGNTFNVFDYVFDSNESQKGQGGAVYASGATLNITDTKFTGNIAKTDGGAVYGAGGTTSVVRGTNSKMAIFDGNKANGGSIGGGAYAIGNGSLDVDGYLFKNNYAADKGGAIELNATAQILKISNSEFNANYTDGMGGAIYSRGKTLDIDTTDFIGNYTVDSHGGAIYQTDGAGTVTLDSTTDSKFEGNKAQGEGSLGGAIYIAKGSLTANGYTFTGNEASDGGAIYLPTGVTGTINGSAFNANKATTYGGAICADTATLNMTGTSFTENESTYGGAIHSYASTVTATSCGFTSNVSAGAATQANGLGKGGGALNIVGNSDITLNAKDNVEGTFTSNTTNNWGGAIYVTDSKLSVNGYNFTTNTAKHAAAILFDDDTELISEAVVDDETTEEDETAAAVYDELNTDTYTVANSNFTKNSAANSGGAFYNNKGTIAFTDCKFVENSSAAQGGVMYISGGNVSFEGTDASKAIFESNSATNGAGGALRTASATVNVTGYTFTKNTSSGQGGAIYHNGSGYVLTVEDCMFGGTNAEGESLGNTATDGGAIYNAGSAKTIVKASDSPIVTPIFEKNKSTSTNIGGGAIAIGTGDLEIYDYQFVSNSAARGGAICHNGATGALNISETIFDGNNATTYQGGAIYTQAKLSTITCSSFTNNSSTKSEGGAIYVNNNKVVLNVVEGSSIAALFKGNSATSGGAISVRAQSSTSAAASAAIASTLEVSGYTFDGNKASSNGGAVMLNNTNNQYSVGVQATLNSCTFVSNSATGAGGAICNNQWATVYKTASSMNISGCTFGEEGKGNTAGTKGGAVRMNQTAYAVITNSTFVGNSATTATSGAIQHGDAGKAVTFSLSGSTFSGNTTYDIYSEKSSVFEDAGSNGDFNANF